MAIVKAAIISTVLVLVVIFAFNRLPFTRDLVQAAIK